MQKTPFSLILREELIRALVFGLGFFIIISTGCIGVAYAANGGEFGRILNMILASGNWEAPSDGTVKNAQKLGNKLPGEFVQLSANPADRSCGVNQCIYGFDNAGKALCH